MSSWHLNVHTFYKSLGNTIYLNPSPEFMFLIDLMRSTCNNFLSQLILTFRIIKVISPTCMGTLIILHSLAHYIHTYVLVYIYGVLVIPEPRSQHYVLRWCGSLTFNCAHGWPGHAHNLSQRFPTKQGCTRVLSLLTQHLLHTGVGF